MTSYHLLSIHSGLSIAMHCFLLVQQHSALVQVNYCVLVLLSGTLVI